MWTFLTTTVVGKWIGIGVLTVVLVGGGAYVFYQKGKTVGIQEGKVSQLEEDKKVMQQERQQFQEVLKTQQQVIEEANRTIAQAQLAFAQATARVAVLNAQRDQGRQQVAALPDSALFADIVKKVNVRAPGDQTSTFTISEMRQIDVIVTDYPQLQAQDTARQTQVTALAEKVSGLEKRMDATEKQRDAAILWSNQLMGHYVKAYNAAQRRPNWFVRIVTLGLYKGRHLDLPDPVTLQKGAPS